MEKTITIANLEVGQTLTAVPFALKELEAKTSQQNKPYFNLLLSDKTGEIRGRIFENSFSSCDTNIDVGQIVTVSGNVKEYLGKPQLIVETMSLCTQMAPEEFLPLTSRDRDQMISDLMGEVKKIKDPNLKKLHEDFWNDKNNYDKFVNYPAAEMVHHAYVGGLLEHTWEMYKLTKPYVELYPQLDWDLMFTGLIFHDIGKIEELEISGATILRNTSGRLVAHIAQGLLILDRLVSNIKDFPEELRDKLYHLILSHQGKLEYGSPVQPQTLEAMVLSFVDSNSADLNQATKHIERSTNNENDFTDRHKWLGRSLYQKDYNQSE